MAAQSASVRQATHVPAAFKQNGVADPAAQTASSPQVPQTPFWHDVGATHVLGVVSSLHVITQRPAAQVSPVAQSVAARQATQRWIVRSQRDDSAAAHCASPVQATHDRDPVRSQCRTASRQSPSPEQVGGGALPPMPPVSAVPPPAPPAPPPDPKSRCPLQAISTSPNDAISTAAPQPAPRGLVGVIAVRDRRPAPAPRRARSRRENARRTGAR